ncbi:MAG: c-type cytochrome [Thiovulaceae bacterium]|nr:c-type cytochrome [Sulfurimonadaceae bacterium]
MTKNKKTTVAAGLALSSVLLFSLVGCGGGKGTQEQDSASKAIVETTPTAQEAEQVVTDVKAAPAAKEITKEVADESEMPIIEKASKEPAQVATIEKAIVPSAMKTGADLYKGCTSCHGMHAEKAALGKSQIIQGWPAQRVQDALNGYKDGTYGAAMKGVMTGQVSKLSDDDMKLVSKYISNL